MTDLLYRVENAVATIQLNRPEHKNSFTLEMIDEWAARLEQAGSDPEVGAIVTTGSGDSFCAGVDLNVMTALQQRRSALEWKKVLWERVHKVAFALERIDKPVIAAINGVAVGAGMDMALMCDIRYAAQSARFAETYIKVGLVPGAGGAHFLPRLVGVSKALELFFTGDFVDAQEALRLGIVNRVFPDATLMPEVEAIARRMCEAPPLTLRMIKRAVYQGMRNDLRTNLDLISSHYAIITASQEHKDLVRRFIAARAKKRVD